MEKLDSKNIRNILALTPMQEGMLFHYLQDPQNGLYFEQLSLEISGEIDAALFERAWNAVIESNEMLRAVYRWEKLEKPSQIILKEHKCSVVFHDLTTQKKLPLAVIKENDRRNTFDLHRVPFRVILCKLAEKRYEMIISNHHILYDGWSNGIILKEFFKIYHELTQSGQVPQFPIKPPFKEFIKWVQSRDKNKQEQFWREYLADVETATELPLKNKIATAAGTGGYSFILDADLSSKLDVYSKNDRVTPAAIFYTAWGILLQKYGGSQDVVFGTTVSGRSGDIKEIENMVGLCINTIPLRIQSIPGETIGAAIIRTNRQLREREAFENTALVDIGSHSNLGGPGSLFDTILAIENYPLDNRLVPRGCSLAIDSYSLNETTHYDLSVGIVPAKEIEISFHYKQDLFEKETITNLAGHFTGIIHTIIEKPGTELSQLEIISLEEKTRILHDFNNTKAEFPADKTIHQLFAGQAEKTPDHIALVGADLRVCPVCVTYRRLNEHSNRLAGLLIEKGVQPDNIVGIMMERSIEMVIGILGILKSGGAYLPIDPDYPKERSDYMLKDSGTKILLTGAECISNFHHSPFIIHHSSHSSHLAYLIYTSGSTGRPKGVAVEHSQLVNFIYHMYRRYDQEVGVHDRCLGTTHIMFDVSIWELFLPLTFGARFVLLDGQNRFDVFELVAAISREKITLIYLPPALLEGVCEHLKASIKYSRVSLNKMLVGVEPIRAGVLAEYMKSNPDMKIINGYGPTETTICASSYNYYPHEPAGEIVPIGTPLSNNQIVLLDAAGHITPVGIAGEICISGAGVSRGYLNNPELTAEKYTPHPYYHNKRMYRTGDMAHWLPDGNIRFTGRKDNQVKLRGYRVELGEIENRLLNHNTIKSAAVIAWENEDKGKYLCAYIVPRSSGACDVSLLKEYLQQCLPGYMIPAHFVLLTEIPLTASGKIDRRALPQPEIVPTARYIAPRNELEEKLAEIWAGILGIEKQQIGIDYNFFEIGGHSLKATQLTAKIYKTFNIKIPLSEIFRLSSIRTQAHFMTGPGKIEKDDGNGQISIQPAPCQEYYDLSYAQRRLWIICQFEEDSIAYNEVGGLAIKGKFNPGAFDRALQAMAQRHESLRTVFVTSDGEPKQKILSQIELKLQQEDLRHLKGDRQKTEAALIIKNTANKAFNLEKGPLAVFKLLHLEDEKYFLLVNIHHIINDGWSVGVIKHELNTLYNFFNKDLPGTGEIPLAPVTFQYKDYSLWHNRLIAGG
ncbi:MAG TPA: amino acid adenylation domain-containing protein, partial [Candidatus Kapabacteria bacterium]|nr:amino acid adenylation domain-containing protein [Candidatus Kapabacteria bacterium]